MLSSRANEGKRISSGARRLGDKNEPQMNADERRSMRVIQSTHIAAMQRFESFY
jgi:hypothetical protein